MTVEEGAAQVQDGMRIDVVSIFPEYLEPLNISLVGKARSAASWTCTSTTCASGPTTCTGPWTTARTVAAPAW